jgi:hypothetical protein
VADAKDGEEHWSESLCFGGDRPVAEFVLVFGKREDSNHPGEW